MIQRLKVAALVVAAAPAGCSGPSEEIAFNAAPLSSMAQCPDLDEGDGVAKVCVTDDHGNFYSPLLSPSPAAADGVLVVPGGRELSIVYAFTAGFVPNAVDVASGNAVQTFAAAYALPLPSPSRLAPSGGPVGTNASATATSSPCCAEDLATNRVASHAVLEGALMTVRLDDIPSDGLQVAAVHDDASLYASRISPTCDLPADRCRYPLGFALRFYVGHRP
jgi:hypothetical protein